MTCCMTPATWNFTSEIASRAAAGPRVSIVQAVCRTSSRAASMAARLSAIHSWTDWRLPSRSPGASSRVAARSHIMSKARRQTPIHRIAWWIRPGPSRACAMAKPAPSSPSRFSRGTRHPSNASSAWLAQSSPACPMQGMLRTRRKPGVSAGTISRLARPCGPASGSVTAMTMAKRAPSAPEANHLRPSMT